MFVLSKTLEEAPHISNAFFEKQPYFFKAKPLKQRKHV